jgi:hypothetical protein
MSAFGGKADMVMHREMSAYDPKLTLFGAEQSELAIITSPFNVLV